MINTFIHSHSSLENRTRSQTKMGKVSTRFQTKTPQKPYPRRHVRDPRQSWILDLTPWIPDSNYWIPDLFQWNFDSGFGLLVGFRIPTPVFRIPQEKISKIPDSKCKNFPDSGIRIPLHGATTR